MQPCLSLTLSAASPLCVLSGLPPPHQVTFHKATIANNEATAIRVQGGAQLHLDSCLIANNTQGFGESLGGGVVSLGLEEGLAA